MLTTVDNPYDPFTEFDEWNAFDVSAGYNTTSLLARTMKSSVELSDADQSQEMEDAIAVVVKENISGVHRMVTRK